LRAGPKDFRPDHVKIDVEGRKLRPLRVGQAMIEKSRPAIWFGAVVIAGDGSQEMETAFFDGLSGEGYQVDTPFALVYGKSRWKAAQFSENREFAFQAFNHFARPTEKAAAFGAKTL